MIDNKKGEITMSLTEDQIRILVEKYRSEKIYLMVLLNKKIYMMLLGIFFVNVKKKYIDMNQVKCYLNRLQ